MPRPVGARNKDFDEKRQSLISKLTDYALNADMRRPSLRQLAIAVETSEPTLRHYFGDRKGLVLAIMEEIGRRGTDIWDLVATPSGDVAGAITEYFRISEVGMRHGGFVRAHAFGLIEGFADDDVGEAYLQHVLNPALDCIEQKLNRTAGHSLDDAQRKSAAFAALSPLLVLSLHQDLLGGSASHQIDVGETIDHLCNWLGNGLLSGVNS